MTTSVGNTDHPDRNYVMEESPSSNWYAIHTRYQHEKTAARILEYKEFQVFLPLYQVRRRWQDRIKDISVPLFPGYLFIKEGMERSLAILTTPGVCNIVSTGGQPAAIPFTEIDGVRRVVESTLRVEPHPFLKCGDWVRVRFGPVAGVEGILLRKKNIARLVLSVGMLGKAAAVEVDASHVERIPAKSVPPMSALQPAVFHPERGISVGFCGAS